MKKMLAALLSLIMLFALIPATLAESADFVLEIKGGDVEENLDPNANNNLKVDVYLNGCSETKKLSAINFDLTYDKNQITFDSFKVTSNGLDLKEVNVGTAGRIVCGFTSNNGIVLTADEPLVTLYFSVSDNVARGDEIAFDIIEGEGSNPGAGTPDAEALVGEEYVPCTVGTNFKPYVLCKHVWGTPTYTWSSDNKKCTAKAVCTKYASHVITETVSTTYKVTKEPAPGVAGVGTYTATFKNEPFKTQTKNETIPALANKKATVEVKESDVQFSGKTPYRVYNGKAQTPGYIVKDEKGNVIPASKYKAEYKENVKAGTAYIFITFPNKDYTDCRTFFKIYLPATTWTKVENVENGIKVSWTKVEDAAGYVVYRRAWNLVDSGWTKFERWNNTTATSWIDTKVYAGTRYQYGVKAYFAKRTDPVSHAQIGGALDNYNLGLVGPLKTTVRITTRTLNSVTPGSKKLTVKWSGSSVFTGYQVQVATDAKFTTDVKTVTISNAKTYETTVKSLKAKTTYYVRVRSYHVFEGTTYYGQWSNVLNAKTK